MLSGVVVLGPVRSRAVGDRAHREVTFATLEPATIDLYLASGEWRDRAGAYAIQGLGSILVERLHGDFSNVVGLPIALLLQLAPELSGILHETLRRTFSLRAFRAPSIPA